MSNRVNEILKTSTGNEWRHFPGSHNPVNLLSRAISAPSLIDNSLWWAGQPWLALPRSEWPQEISVLHSASTELAVVALNCSNEPEEPLINLTRFSKFSPLIRVTSYVFRFTCKPSEGTGGPLTTTELQSSEKYWIKHTQAVLFTQEISAIKSKRDIKSSLIWKLSSHFDELGLLRVRGRLSYLKGNERVKHPIILDSRFTIVVVVGSHVRFVHSGVRDTIVELREKF